MKRRVMLTAWALRAAFATFSEALRQAWKIVKLQNSINTEDKVEFTYKKVDGSTRVAAGSNANLPYTGSQRKEPNYGVVVYWDLIASGFRSFRGELLV